jgi:FKBP-type peptidyl-prolyl cis-trans isomerase FkpA
VKAPSNHWLWLALPMLLLRVTYAADAPATASAAAPAPPGGTASAPASAHPKRKPASAASATTAAAMSDDQKALYALGVLMSRGLENFQLSESEFNTVRAGLSDSFHKRLLITDAESYTPKLQALQRDRVTVLAQQEKASGQAYLEEAAKGAGATRTASGLLFVPVSEGTGAAPSRSDRVKVDYEGKLIDGTVFDSSIKRGQPAVFNVGGVIPCWSEALMLMKVGGKSHVICPAELAYGDRGAPPRIRPGATLVFDISLLDILPPPAAPAGGAGTAAPPATSAMPQGTGAAKP